MGAIWGGFKRLRKLCKSAAGACFGAETFIYGTRQQEAQGVAATPGELPPGEVIVRIPGAVGPAIGERIRAVAASDKLHLFTADGRKRVGG